MKRIIDDLMYQATSIGGVVVYGLIMVLLFGLGFVNESVQLFIGLVLSYLIVFIVRNLHFVERPEKRKYSNYLEKIDASSFPSLHGVRTPILVLVLMSITPHLIIQLGYLIMGLVVLYSRIYLKKHRVIDVLVGTFIGVIIYLGISLI